MVCGLCSSFGESYRGQNHHRGDGNGYERTDLRPVEAGPDTRNRFGCCGRKSITCWPAGLYFHRTFFLGQRLFCVSCLPLGWRFFGSTESGFSSLSPQPAAQISDHMEVIYKCLWQWSDPRRIGCGMQIHRRGSICCSVGVMPGTWSETLSLKNTCGARELVWESPPDIPEWSPHGAPWTVEGVLINNRTWRQIPPPSCPGQGKHFNSEVKLARMPAGRSPGPGHSPA